MEIKIRRYKAADDRRIAEITKSAWPEVTLWKIIEDKYGKRGGKDWWHYKIEPLLNFAKSNPDQVIIAEVNGLAAGYAKYIIDNNSLIGTVADNAVDPEYGGKGIGSLMHKEVLNSMKKAGMQVAKVGTFEHQKPARKMYEKHGFKQVCKEVIYLKSLV